MLQQHVEGMAVPIGPTNLVAITPSVMPPEGGVVAHYISSGNLESICPAENIRSCVKI